MSILDGHTSLGSGQQVNLWPEHNVFVRVKVKAQLDKSQKRLSTSVQNEDCIQLT